MHEDEKCKSIIERECPSCYKKDWCMLTPYQRAIECLGPFNDEEDNWKKYREYFEKEEKQKADLDKAVREVVMKAYLRNKKLFDEWVFMKNEHSDDD